MTNQIKMKTKMKKTTMMMIQIVVTFQSINCLIVSLILNQSYQSKKRMRIHLNLDGPDQSRKSFYLLKKINFILNFDFILKIKKKIYLKKLFSPRSRSYSSKSTSSGSSYSSDRSSRRQRSRRSHSTSRSRSRDKSSSRSHSRSHGRSGSRDRNSRHRRR